MTKDERIAALERERDGLQAELGEIICGIASTIGPPSGKHWRESLADLVKEADERDEAHAELQDAVSRYHALAAKWDLSKSQLDEAHAAIRAYKGEHDRDKYDNFDQPCACLICVEHAPAIRRASEGK